MVCPAAKVTALGGFMPRYSRSSSALRAATDTVKGAAGDRVEVMRKGAGFSSSTYDMPRKIFNPGKGAMLRAGTSSSTIVPVAVRVVVPLGNRALASAGRVYSMVKVSSTSLMLSSQISTVIACVVQPGWKVKVPVRG